MKKKTTLTKKKVLRSRTITSGKNHFRCLNVVPGLRHLLGSPREDHTIARSINASRGNKHSAFLKELMKTAPWFLKRFGDPHICFELVRSGTFQSLIHDHMPIDFSFPFALELLHTDLNHT